MEFDQHNMVKKNLPKNLPNLICTIIVLVFYPISFQNLLLIIRRIIVYVTSNRFKIFLH